MTALAHNRYDRLKKKSQHDDKSKIQNEHKTNTVREHEETFDINL